MKMSQKRKVIGFCLALPFLCGFALFYLIPFAISVYYTFTFGNGRNALVGFQNYISVLSSHAFQLAAYNTARFILIGVPLIIAISFLLSLLIDARLKRNAVFKSIFLYPMIVPTAAVVMIFQIVFSKTGIINSILPNAQIDWLQSEYAFAVLILLYIWKNCGYCVILLSVGLLSIPEDFYSTAEVEGATRFQKFFQITLPLMLPTLFFVLTVSIVNVFKVFREAYLLAGSMPHSSIYMLQHYMNNNLANLNYQRLSVGAVLVFIVIFLLLAVLYVALRKRGDIEL